MLKLHGTSRQAQHSWLLATPVVACRYDCCLLIAVVCNMCVRVMCGSVSCVCVCVCVCERIVSLVLRCASVCFSPGFGVLVASASAMAEGGVVTLDFATQCTQDTEIFLKRGLPEFA